MLEDIWVSDPKTDPPVHSVRVVGPEELQLLKEEKKVCDLLVWFHRPPELSDIKFADLYGQFIRDFKKPSDTSEYFTVNKPEINRPVYLKPRVTKILTCMKMIYITVGEPSNCKSASVMCLVLHD